MRRIGTREVLLGAALMSAWLVAFGLHVSSVVRTGLAQPAFFVSAPEHADAYPRVRGFRLETGGNGSGLQVGDRLLRIEERDLRGVGHIGVDAIAIAEADGEHRVAITYERDGKIATTSVELPRPPVPWSRIPVLAGTAIVALVVLLRAPPSARPSLIFASLMTMILVQTPFHGELELQTWASKLVFYGLGTVAPSLILYWVLHFPAEVAPRSGAVRALPWLFVPAYAFLRVNYFLDGPLPPGWDTRLVALCDGLVFASILAGVGRSYLHASPVGRRQLKWFIYGTYAGFGPIALVTLVFPLVDPEIGWYSQAFAGATVLAIAFPLGLLIGIVRQHLFDVDRLISATASYTALGVVVLAGAMTVVPRIAAWASGVLGIEPATGQIAFTALLALAVVPAHQRLRPQIDRLFFPERHSLEIGAQGLLAELSAYGRPQELIARVGERLDALLRPQSSVGYVRRAEGFAPLFLHGRELAPDLDARGPLVAALQRSRGPIAADAGGPRGRGRPSAFERAALEELEAACVVPIEVDGELAGFLCFGPKRSGDIYTATDLGWLGAIADKVASQLRRFEDAAQIREERRLQSALRDYVPGSVAARLASGQQLESEEREVTVLFVDIRAYSSYAEGRQASEIFSTVNRYTEEVSRIIGENRGTVVEFSGDGLMAVFGAPESLERKERAAVVAAQEIVLAMRALQSDAPLAVGIGIATGPAFVGSIRSADRLIWSALGNTTNLASRLQGLTRELEAAAVIDAVTHARAGPIASDFEPHPRLSIRGLSEPHDVFAKRAP